jgi:hypothetical protein
VLTSIPNWAGRAAETEDLVFRGAYADQADYAVHIAMMRAGRMGDWAYQMRFTSETHQPAFLRMFYVILGHLSRWLGLSVETTFELARWVFGMAALFAIYRLCLRIFPEREYARAAFALTAFGSGLGWLQLMLGAPLQPISPIDFWLIDAYIFFSISLFPSFSFTLMLMAAALSLFLDYLASPAWQKILWISLLAIACQIVNPIAFVVIDLAFVGAVAFEWWNARKITWIHVAALCCIAAAQIPLLAYNFVVLSRDAVWSQFTRQNQTLSPPPSFYLWGFLPFWPFAVYGMVRGFKVRTPAWGAMATWTLSAFALAYLPVFIQRRFLLGITIPLGILGIFGLAEFFKTRKIDKRQNILLFSYILFAGLSTIYLVLGSSLFMQTHAQKSFYPRDLESALQWLDQNATPDDVALSAADSGQLVGQRTRLIAYVGHEMETLYFENKKSITQAYFKNTAPADWLEQTNIQWIIYGSYEQAISPDFQPADSLRLVYENNTVKIYEVTAP